MQQSGKKSDIPVIATDFYPTILELANLPLMTKMHVDGKSIVPILEGGKIKERPLFWHYPHYGNQGGRPVSMIRNGDWKLIHFWEDGHDELYNLPKDIHEDTDLARSNPKITTEMSATLLNWLKDVGAKYPTPDPLYNQSKEAEAIANTKKQKRIALEAFRKDMLNKEWEPNDNWWGSIPTID